MRYLNWDVLLFPGPSRVPMQEFKTACYVVHDSELLHDDVIAGHGQIRQVPIVNCFMANQPDGNPFKVSIHSWVPPEITESLRLLQNASSIDGPQKLACFEARVIVDGTCTASMIIMGSGPFPHIIEQSFHMNKEGRGRDLLRWPAFHQQMLTQNSWNVSENLGRIKITISEGFVHGNRESPFIRTKNVVTFSFQHAPQYALENTGIAWPNKGMWMQASQQLYNPSSPGKRQIPIDPELHAHSPTRRNLSLDSRPELPALHQTSGLCMAPPPLPSLLRGSQSADIWGAETGMPDPFVDRRHTQRSDVSMPDYSDSGSDKPLWPDIVTRNSTMVVTASIPQAHEHRFDDIINLADSPTHQQSGVQPPTNTRASSADNTPFLDNQVRVGGEQQPNISCSAAAIGKEPQRPSHFVEVRKDSDATMRSQVSFDDQENEDPFAPSSVKSKKEGSNQRLSIPPQLAPKRSDDALTNATVSTGSIDGKRKRVAASLRKVSKTENLDLPSPRKVSKLEADYDSPGQGDDTAQSSSSTARRPLAQLGN